MKFYPAKIESIESLTSAAVNIILDVSQQDKPNFTFKAGQHLVLRIPNLDPAIHRSYSISAAPYESKLQIGVKKVNAGLVSTYLIMKAQIGDTIEIMEPSGSFIIPQNSSFPHIVALVSGSGITPVISMIKDQLISNPTIKISLFYGNKDSFSRMYQSTLEELKALYRDRLNIHHIYSRQKTGLADLEGRIDVAKLNKWKEYLFTPSQSNLYLLCGPGDMVGTLEKELMKIGVKKEAILTEYFTPPESTKDNATLQPTDNQEHLIRIKHNKKWFDLTAKNNQEVILDLGLRQGLDLPYSCKSGVCSTCQAKLLKGEVRMDNNYVLSDKEVQQGFILTCQSHALTKEIEVDYDMK